MTLPIYGIVRRDSTKPVGQQLSPGVYTDLNARFASIGDSRAVESFGAHGDNASDDTAAWEAAIAWVQVGGRRLTAPYGKRYLITRRLVIDTLSRNWAIDAHGARIVQNTNGEPIFDFTVEGLHEVRIDVQLDWTTPQTPAMATAAIRFDNGGSNTSFLWYHFDLDVQLFNAHDGIVTRDVAGHKNGMWDSRLRIRAYYGCTGTPIRLGSGTVGQTGLDIDVYCHRETSAEPVVKLVVADAPRLRVKMDGENQSAANGIVLEACSAVEITGRQERGYLADGDAVISLTECQGVEVNFAVQAIQTFTGARQSVIKCLKGDYAGAIGTAGVNLHGAYSTYAPQPNAPSTMRTAYVDDGSEPLASDSFVLQGQMGRAFPVGKQPTGASAEIADNSIPPSKLVNGGTVPGVGKFYENGRWVTVTGSGGGTTVPALRKQSIMALGHSLMAVMPLYDPSTGVNSYLNGSGGSGPGDFIMQANALEGSPFDYLGGAATAGYTVQQIRDTWLPVVLAAKPEYCVVWAPCANNILAGGEFTTATLDVEKYIYDQLDAAGIKPIMATLPPAANSSNAGFSPNELFRYSAWAADYATSKGYDLLDFYAALVDPATGSYRAGESTDATHPGNGAWRLVEPTRALFRRMAIRDGAYFLPGDNLALTGRAANPLLAGTLGANLPTGWSSATNVSVNLAAGAYPILGNVLTITATAAFGYVIAQPLTGTPGQKWDLAMRVKTAPVANGGWGWQIYDQNGGQRHNWGHPSLPNPTQLALEKPFHARSKFASGVAQLGPVIFVHGVGSQLSIAQYGFTNPSGVNPSVGI